VQGGAPGDPGIAAGLIGTSLQIGGAIGLATLTAIATAATDAEPRGIALPDALTHGYTTALLGGAVIYLTALAVLTLTTKRRNHRQS
jgi:hypothetical protein